MKFLADAHFPQRSIDRLRAFGFDVVAVRAHDPRMVDEAILAWAVRDGRVLLTFGRDFSRLVYRERRPVPPGIVYFRLDNPAPGEPAAFLIEVIAGKGLSLSGQLTLIERGQVRQRRLPRHV